MAVAMKTSKSPRSSTKMKSIATVLIATLLVQGIAAKPESLFGDVFSSFTDGAEEAGSVFGGYISGAVGGAEEIFAGVFSKTQDVVGNIFSASVDIMSGYANEAQKFAAGIYERVAELNKNMEDAFRRMTRFGGSKITDAANAIKGHVGDINGKVSEMMGQVEEKFHEGMEKVNKSIEEHSAKLTEMVNEIKDKYKDAKDLSEEDKKKIDQLIEDFTKKSSDDLSVCAKEIVEPLKNLHEEAKSAVNGILPAVEGSIKTLKECLRSAGFKIWKMTDCASQSRSSLPDIEHTEDFAKGIKSEIENFKLDDILDMSCMEGTLNEIKKRKDELDQEIGKIVEKKE